MFPEWESNLQPFGVLDDAPTNQTTWTGLYFLLYVVGKVFLLHVSESVEQLL